MKIEDVDTEAMKAIRDVAPRQQPLTNRQRDAVAATRARMRDGHSFEKLLACARALPPMTDEQKIEQKISWAYGNTALSWPDGESPPMTRDRFEAIAWREEWRKLRAKLEAIPSDPPLVVPNVSAKMTGDLVPPGYWDALRTWLRSLPAITDETPDDDSEPLI